MTAKGARFRLLALDLDGTLLGSDKRITPRTLEGLATARGRGVELVLVTGRRLPAVRSIAATLGGSCTLVLHNGALVVRGDAVIACRPLPRELAVRAIASGRRARVCAVAHLGQAGQGRLLVEDGPLSSPQLAGYLEWSRPSVQSVPDLSQALLAEEDPIQIMFGGSVEQMAGLRGPLAAALGPGARLERTSYPGRGLEIVDVLSRSAGKAAALELLARRAGIARQQILAIGDNWNDREMLELAGQGLVMGNAAPELRALGLPVLPTNDEEGVALAVERYVINQG